MHNLARAQSSTVASRRTWFLVGVVLFCFASIIYILFRLDPAISLHGTGPAFLYGPAFRSAFINKPGGWVEYASAFLARCDARPILGSLIQVGLALALVLLTRGVSKTIAGISLGAAAFIPGFLSLLLRQTWGYQSYTASLALALALLSALALAFVHHRPAWLRISFCWVIAVPLFYLAGPLAVIAFALLAPFLEIYLQRQGNARAPHRADLAAQSVSSPPASPTAPGRACGKYCLAIACLTPVVLPLVWVVLGPDPESWKSWIPNTALPRALLFALVAWPPLVVLALLWFPKPAPASTSDTSRAGKKPKLALRSWRQSLEPFGISGVLIAGLAALWLTFDHTTHARVQIDYYSSRADHSRVVDIARTLGPGPMDAPSELRLHRALYHTGRLVSDLFSFPQAANIELFPSLSGDLRNCRPQAETLFELGLVNDAEHFAHEAMEWEGERPEIFRFLAKVNCSKDRPAAARVFLNRLAKIPFEADWARDCLATLETKGTLPDDIGLAEIRSRMLTRDIAHDSLMIEPLLLALLAANNTNRMAYDFLMAHYLVNLELQKLTDLLPQLERFGYREIPAHAEEALVLYQNVTGKEAKLPNLRIRDSTRNQFAEFGRIFNQETQLKRNPLPTLSARFQKTYWFYHVIHQARASENPK